MSALDAAMAAKIGDFRGSGFDLPGFVVGQHQVVEGPFHPDTARFERADDCACGNVGTHVCAQCDTFLCAKCAKASTGLHGERQECER